MGEQIRAILWAQFRTFRNFLPRTGLGSILAWLLSLCWYSFFGAIAFALAAGLPKAPTKVLPFAISIGLFCILLFWQIFPLMTLSSGASLELSKLLIYPVREKTLFAVEVLLRFTTAPEMIIVLAGGITGLMRHANVSRLSVLWLLIYIPINLLSSLAMREWLIAAFQKKHLKVVFLVLFLTISVLPNLVLNTTLGERLKPVFIAAAGFRGTPWHELSSIVFSGFSLKSSAILLGWLAAAYAAARKAFSISLKSDSFAFESRPGRGTRPRESGARSHTLASFLGRMFRDPLGALVEKELRILTRSPRFRVIFGMACVFSAVVFIPFSSGRLATGFMSQNYLPTVSMYGLLIVGEVLLWNNLGFDRKAAQLYFITPVPFATVLRAKNIAACLVIFAMSLLVTAVGAILRTSVTASSVVSSLSLTLVLTLFFLAFGNLTSVSMPRPVDPGQAMRKQKSAQASLWFFISMAVLIVPVGLAFAARWAFDSDWPFFGVLAVDTLLGALVYKVATDSAIERAGRDREKILDALSAGSDPIG